MSRLSAKKLEQLNDVCAVDQDLRGVQPRALLMEKAGDAFVVIDGCFGTKAADDTDLLHFRCSICFAVLHQFFSSIRGPGGGAVAAGVPVGLATTRRAASPSRRTHRYG